MFVCVNEKKEEIKGQKSLNGKFVSGVRKLFNVKWIDRGCNHDAC